MSDAQDQELLREAWAVLERSYSPYSKMRVGAVLETADGRRFSGCNVENASFGLTICAERSAIASAVSSGVREFATIAIVSDADAPLMPCGACRQTLLEFAPDLRVLIEAKNGECVATTIGELLPHSFRPDDLERRDG